MKKIIIVYALLIILIIAFAFLRGGKLPIFSLGGKAQAEINNKTFNLLVVKTTEEKSRGLSGRKNLDANTGMLFIFDEKAKYTFWMRDMEFPIDIIYIDNNKVVDIAANAEPPKEGQSIMELEKFTPDEEANYVLEINAGLAQKNNIKEGDTIEFKNLR